MKSLIAVFVFFGTLVAKAQNNTASPVPPPPQAVDSAAKPKRNSDLIIARAIELYNRRDYIGAINLLEKNKNIREENVSWYYYYGLNLGRLDRHDEAIIQLDQFVKRSDLFASARAFYFIGLMHFYKGNYDKAINNLDVSLDVSRDPKLDRAIDALMDKVVRYKNYYENRKPTNLTVLFGYNYDSNTLNLSQKLSQVPLEGHVFNYGFSFAHRFIDQLSFVFEPSLTVTDAYTFDKTFKADSTLQEGDTLQILFTAPVVFNLDKEKSNTQYELSLNAYTSYAQAGTTKREQFISSYFLKGRLTTDFTPVLNFTGIVTAAQDQSVTVSTAANKADGSRGELELFLNHYLNKEKTEVLGYELNSVIKGAVGNDARYNRSGVAVSYQRPSWASTSSMLRLGYDFLTYPDRTIARKDNRFTLDYFLSQPVLDESGLITYFAGAESAQSNYEVNTYNDFKLGLAYTHRFGF